MLITAAMIICAINAIAQTPAYVSLNAAQLQEIAYTWPITNTDAVNQAANRVGNLTDVVYVSNDYNDMSVAQAIALIRKVYTDKRVPGIWYRGYTQDNGDGTGQPEGDVAYQAVGKIRVTNYSNRRYTYGYDDAYGWGIGPDDNNPIEEWTGTRGLARFDMDQYKPNQQGYTVLLIEIKNGYNPADAYPTQGSTPYENLCRYFAQAIKSVRVLTQSVRTNEGSSNAGTLFKLNVDDCDQFFLISKGQARRYRSYESISYSWGQYDYTNPYWHPFYSAYYARPGDYYYYDREVGGSERVYSKMFPFYHMFEQFSPTNATDGTIVEDVLQRMKKGETPTIVHDCISVFTAEGVGHGFKMTGQTGQAENVQDLMFLIPDRRLTDWSGRDVGSSYEFIYYNSNYTNYQPTTGIYAIVLDGTASQTNIQVPDDEDPQAKYYKIDLEWKSNLDKFLSNHQQKFLLYYITKDEQGNDVEVPVKRWDAEHQCFTNEEVVFDNVESHATIRYTDYVPMESHGKEITYMVKGIDISPEGENFLTLHPSNKKTFFISGYDKHELLQLAIHANYKSTYDPQTNLNYYTNEVPLSNSSGDTRVSKKFLTKDSPTTTLHFKRKVSETDEGVTFATAELTALTDNQATFKVTTDAQDATYVNCRIYTADVKDNDGNIVHYKDEVDFSNFVLYDNFSVEPNLGTDHRNEYVYQVNFTAAEPFVEGDDNKEVYSNMPKVPVFKTDLHFNVEFEHTKEQVDDDTDHSLAAQPINDAGNNLIKYSMQVIRESSTQEVHDVSAYCWLPGQTPSLTEVNVIPGEYSVARATNQGAYYQIAPAEAADVNDESDNTRITFASGQNAKWGYFNYVGSDVGTYEFVPVVETISHDGSHNTYGAPIRTAAVGKLAVKAYHPEDVGDTDNALMSIHSWIGDGQSGIVGKYYSYYNILLQFDPIDLPNGYKPYKVRAWRKVNTTYQGQSILGEQLPTRRVRVTPLATGDVAVGNEEYLYEELNFGDALELDASGEVENRMDLGPLQADNFFLGKRSTKINRPDGNPVFEHQDGEWAYGTDQDAAIRNETRSTFGALRLKVNGQDGTDDGMGSLTELDVDFIVRVYFTKVYDPSQNRAPRLNAGQDAVELVSLDDKYYVAEGTCNFKIVSTGSNVITGIMDVAVDHNREVQGVTYYNTVGIPSQQPWSGVNIVVTRYTDGSTTTAKIIR